MGLKDDFIIA